MKDGGHVTWAKQLGRDEAATILQSILDEERATDEKLTKLAESKINKKAELQTA